MKKKIIQLFYILAFTSTLLIYVTGCLFGQQPYTKVNYYDLDSPPQIVLKKVQLNFIPLDSTEPVKYKMMYHNAKREIVIDDYNKWVQTPGLLLTRYLQSAFKQKGITSEESEFVISGNIFMFRIDLESNKVSLGVSYVIKSSKNNIYKTLFRNSTVFSTKLKYQGPSYFAIAMSECASQLVLTIEQDIKKIQKHQMTAKKAGSKAK